MGSIHQDLPPAVNSAVRVIRRCVKEVRVNYEKKLVTVFFNPMSRMSVGASGCALRAELGETGWCLGGGWIDVVPALARYRPAATSPALKPRFFEKLRIRTRAESVRYALESAARQKNSDKPPSVFC